MLIIGPLNVFLAKLPQTARLILDNIRSIKLKIYKFFQSIFIVIFSDIFNYFIHKWTSWTLPATGKFNGFER